jgi:flagellar biosynthesis protein FlhF
MKAREPEKRRLASVITLDYRRRGSALAHARVQQTIDRSDVLTALAQHRVPEMLAHKLADDAAKSGYGDPVRALADALERSMVAMPINYVRANAILLKGANGVGKTTVATKIAAQAYLTRRQVKLIAPDTSALPIRTLTAQIDVKVSTARTAQTIARAVSWAYQDEALVVVDTPGFNPRKAKSRTAFAALGQIERVERIGVVSALCDAVETGEIITGLEVDRVIVTGLDLARRLGAVVVAATASIPLAHVARSPFAGDGLEPLTPMALAQTLLGVRPAAQ